ncbi:MAG: 50S ribosomal protein L2 [Candidatus Micrarchaeia archaeon]
MGKKLRQQRRGKGSIAYRKLPGTFDVDVSYGREAKQDRFAEVVSFFNHTGHNAPIMKLLYEDFASGTMLAPEGIRVGERIHVGPTPVYLLGSVMKLKDIPEGIPIYNIERLPGDGGKYVKAAGESAYIASKSGGMASIMLPSKKIINLSEECMAQLGVIAGGGITEQPLVKAGKSFYIMKRRNRIWPRNRGVKMSPVDHPFGGKQHHKGKSSMTSRNAPPGRKVGNIAARRVGRKKR